jgi:hypothetical protein
MKRFTLVFIIVFILLISLAHTSQAAWLIYSKSEFRGRVIDAETKQPIEGAVVVILYYKRSTFDLNPGGTSSYVTKAKETLTDKNGEFYFPSYSELMWLNEDVGARFIFFKPGYMAGYGPTYIHPYLVEKYFSAVEIGREVEIEAGSFDDSSYVKWRGPLGIMELKKTKPNESMSAAMPDDYSEKDLPLLYKAIEEDDIIRGLLPKGGRRR